MKRLTLSTLICVLISLPALADIGDSTQISLETYDWLYQYGNGGEFHAEIVGAPITIGGTTVGSGYDWETFCLEKNEYVSGDTTIYSAVVNNEAVKGGIGGQDTPNGDTLDPRTAYLYTQFATGNLSNYRYNGTQAQRERDAGRLQRVIWYIENEIGLGKPADEVLGGKALDWFNEAVNAGWKSIGNVRVLNLSENIFEKGEFFECCEQYNQDILVYAPVVPVPAAVLLGILGLSIAGIKLRKFA
jgi:hypothetical protein